MKLSEELSFIAKAIEKEDTIISFDALGIKFVKINSKLYSSELFQHIETWNLIDYHQSKRIVDLNNKDKITDKLYELVHKIKDWEEISTADINTINLNGNLCGIEGYDYEVSLSQLEEESARIGKSFLTFSLRITRE